LRGGCVHQSTHAINRLRRRRPDRTTAASMNAKPAPETAPEEARRTAYLVVGMHRSGTSAVTQFLALAGADLPANVMPGDEHNARGYFEPWKIARFNDERLRAAGSAWDDPFAYPFTALAADDEARWRDRAAAIFIEEYGRARWPLMKDPRATVLLPMWRAALDALGVAARCVIPVRHPRAVAGSLRRRDGFTAEKSVLVWSAYMLAAEAYTRGLPRAFVGYDALLADWRAEAKRIEAAHGAPLPRLTPAAGRKIDQFLSPDLRHNAGDADLGRLGWAGAIAAAVFGWFAARAAGEAPDMGELDAAAAALARRQAEVGPLVSPAVRDLAAAREALFEARGKLAAAEALEAELRAEIARQREVLEEGWRRDVRRLEKITADQASVLAEVSAQLDEALADD
jgi:hypothetical protein